MQSQSSGDFSGSLRDPEPTWVKGAWIGVLESEHTSEYVGNGSQLFSDKKGGRDMKRDPTVLRSCVIIQIDE